ncbi:MAG: hypothetical protein RLZZ502_360 [Pseudomonadota bacterium]
MPQLKALSDVPWHLLFAVALLLSAAYYFLNRHRFRRSYLYGQSTVNNENITLYANTTFEKLSPQELSAKHGPASVQFVGRQKLLDKKQILLYRLLQVAFKEHDVFCRVRLGDVLRPAPHYEHKKRMDAYRSIGHLYVDAVVCDKFSRIIGIVDLERMGERSRRRDLIESYKIQCLQQEQFSYLRIDPNQMPRYKDLFDLLMNQVPRVKEEDLTPMHPRTEFVTISLISKLKMGKYQKYRSANASLSGATLLPPRLTA